MAFQDFRNSKASEKTALEAALARVIGELQAADAAAPAVDSVVSKIQQLMVILKSSPSAVVNAAKEAIRESCGDISMLVSQPREVVTLTVPRFIDEPGISPVLADIIGETSTDSSVTVEVSNTTTANEILPSSLTTTDNSDNGATEEINKPKRRTQPGFDRKVKEWGKIFDNLNADNYESGIAQIDDEYKFWNNGGKFADAEIEERLQGAIAYWTSQTTTEVTEEKTEEKTDKLLNFLLTSLGENSIVIEPDTEDLSSFDVEGDSEELTKYLSKDLSSFDVGDDLGGEETTEDYVPNVPGEITVVNPVTVTEIIEPSTEAFKFPVDNPVTEYFNPETGEVIKIGEEAIPVSSEDLSSFDVDSNDELVETPVQHYTQSFLDKINTNNLSESGLGDLQEEIRTFYGLGNIPQELLDATFTAWGRINEDQELLEPEDDVSDIDDSYGDDDQEDTAIYEPSQIASSLATENGVVLEASVNDGVYDGEIPEDEELEEDPDTARQAQILENNANWQNSILTNCETQEDLADWDRFLSNAIKKDNESVTPETLEALDSVREKLETRDTEQTKTIDKDALIADWANRAELAFDLDELATIWTEIRESGTIPSMLLVKVLDNAKARLTQVEKPTEIAPEPTFTEEEQIARESISNQWQPIAVETPVIETTPVPVEIPTPEPSTPVKTGKPNPFAGRKVEIKKDVAEEATVISEGSSDHVSISKINTSGVFDFRTLEGKIEQHKRFDARYILEPGIKLYEPSTSFVFEIVTWEEAKALSPLMSEDANKLSLKSLHSPARSYSKAVDKTDAFVVVDDQQAHALVAKYRAKLSQMDADAAIPMQVGS